MLPSLVYLRLLDRTCSKITRNHFLSVTIIIGLGHEGEAESLLNKGVFLDYFRPNQPDFPASTLDRHGSFPDEYWSTDEWGLNLKELLLQLSLGFLILQVTNQRKWTGSNRGLDLMNPTEYSSPANHCGCSTKSWFFIHYCSSLHSFCKSFSGSHRLQASACSFWLHWP